MIELSVLVAVISPDEYANEPDRRPVGVAVGPTMDGDQDADDERSEPRSARGGLSNDDGR